MKSIFAFIYYIFEKLFSSGSPVRIGSTIHGTCTWVCDGDTVYVQISPSTRIKVRIAGQDAPEHGQQYGGESKKFLIRLVYKNKVSVQIIDRDQYGRLVGIVKCGGKDVALEILKAGLAWCYDAYLGNLPRQYANAYKKAANEAKKERRGLWRSDNQIPPWVWRKEHREQEMKKNWVLIALGLLVIMVIMVICFG